MNATQLHKAEATILIPPTAPKAAPTAMDAPAKTAPVEDPNAPLPVDKITPINPVRSPVANPYDILDR
jgi:hypothetical protein